MATRRGCSRPAHRHCLTIRLTSLLYMCPHTIMYVSSYYYTCVLILLYTCPHTIMCPHTTVYVSSDCNMCPHPIICVLILLCACYLGGANEFVLREDSSMRTHVIVRGHIYSMLPGRCQRIRATRGSEGRCSAPPRAGVLWQHAARQKAARAMPAASAPEASGTRPQTCMWMPV